MTTKMNQIDPTLTESQASTMKAHAAAALPLTKHPSEVAKQRAILRNLGGVEIFKGADRIVVSSLNAVDHVQHLGWSYSPTLDYHLAQVDDVRNLQPE